MNERPEVWLRGPVPEVPALLQPVAHALLEAAEEVDRMMTGVPDALLWTQPGGVASVGFHLQHLSGILDRLFTYARGAELSHAQIAALDSEGSPADAETDAGTLLGDFRSAIERSIRELADVDVSTLTERRCVGRARLPSTRLGLYVHAAEHTMRHVGQLLVTIRVQLGDGTGGGDL